MNVDLASFYDRAQLWHHFNQEWQRTGDVNFLRKRISLFDITEWWIFEKTLMLGENLNVHEENWLSISPDQRIALQIGQ